MAQVFLVVGRDYPSAAGDCSRGWEEEEEEEGGTPCEGMHMEDDSMEVPMGEDDCGTDHSWGSTHEEGGRDCTACQDNEMEMEEVFVRIPLSYYGDPSPCSHVRHVHLP